MKLTDKLKVGVLAGSLAISGCATPPKHVAIPDLPKLNYLTIEFTINSEPLGARVYEKGKYLGTTPLVGKYYIDNKKLDEFRDMNEAMTEKFTIVKDCYLPETKKFELPISPLWKGEYLDVFSFSSSKLVFLKRDERYTCNVNNSVGNSVRSNRANSNSVRSDRKTTTTIINKDSGFRELNNSLDALYKFNMLKELVK